MTVDVPDDLVAEVVEALRGAGARFALLHGSRVDGPARPGSDVDVAAWWPADPPPSSDVLVPPGVDVVVLNGAPLELAGRIARPAAVRRRGGAGPVGRDDPEGVRRRGVPPAPERPRVRRGCATWSMRSASCGCSARSPTTWPSCGSRP